MITVLRGHARLRSVTGTHDYVNPGTLYLCTASGPCGGCAAAVKLTRFASPGDLGLDGGQETAEVRVHGMSVKDLCNQVATGPSSPPGNSTAPPPPVACGKLPSLGPVVTGGTHTTNDGITTLSCIYSQGPKSFPLGWIIIMTFRSRAAAAKFFNDNIAGTPAPGFTEPVRYGKDCRSATPTATVCARYEFALHGYRIDELTQQSNPPATRALPTLAQTSALMHKLLAVT